jgi:hypothetical protein
MTTNQSFLLGRQDTTGAVHLSIPAQMPRCGGKNIRYKLSNYQGNADEITCKRCQQIALKQLSK